MHDVARIVRQAQSLRLRPRVHGDGFIQLDLPWLQRRLHGWGHPAIPAREDLVHIHDHRFWLHSTVLIGGIRNQVFWLADDPEGAVQVRIVHRVNPSTSRQGPPYEYPVLRDDKRFRLVLFREHSVGRGESYEHPAGVLHRTVPMGPSITLVEKLYADDSYVPRVITEFGKDFDIELRRDTLSSKALYGILYDIAGGVSGRGDQSSLALRG